MSTSFTLNSIITDKQSKAHHLQVNGQTDVAHALKVEISQLEALRMQMLAGEFNDEELEEEIKRLKRISRMRWDHMMQCFAMDKRIKEEKAEKAKKKKCANDPFLE